MVEDAFLLLDADVIKLFQSGRAFAALKSDGSLVTWGSTDHGGDSDGVSDKLQAGVE